MIIYETPSLAQKPELPENKKLLSQRMKMNWMIV